MNRVLSEDVENVILWLWIALGVSYPLVVTVFHWEMLLSIWADHLQFVAAAIVSMVVFATCALWLIVSRKQLKTRTKQLLEYEDTLENIVLERTHELKEAVAELEVLASVDSLTQIANRRHITSLLREEHSRSRRTGREFSIIMLDIDYFKSVNDNYGHAVGDEVLRRVAKKCEEVIRDIDRVGRVGGEEFLIILPDTKLEAAGIIANRLRLEISNLDIGSGIHITVSQGIASNTDEETVNDLLENADHALYEAKELGRDLVILYDKYHMSIANKENANV